jgi:hypothetical protein
MEAVQTSRTAFYLATSFNQRSEVNRTFQYSRPIGPPRDRSRACRCG